MSEIPDSYEFFRDTMYVTNEYECLATWLNKVERADELGLSSFIVPSLLGAANAGAQVARRNETLPYFERLLELYRTEPGEFIGDTLNEFAYLFRHYLPLYLEFPEYSFSDFHERLDIFCDVLTELPEEYFDPPEVPGGRRASVKESRPVAHELAMAGLFFGSHEEMQERFGRLFHTPLTSMDGCGICANGPVLDQLTMLGMSEYACLTRDQLLQSRQPECAAQPWELISRTLEASWRMMPFGGFHWDDHRRAIEHIKGNPELMDLVPYHLEYLALAVPVLGMKAVESGMDLLQRTQDWPMTLETPYQVFRWARAIYHFVDSLPQQMYLGFDPTVRDWPFVADLSASVLLPHPFSVVTAQDAAIAYRAVALELAQAFDGRRMAVDPSFKQFPPRFASTLKLSRASRRERDLFQYIPPMNEAAMRAIAGFVAYQYGGTLSLDVVLLFHEKKILSESFLDS